MLLNKDSAGTLRDLASNGTSDFGVLECNELFAACKKLKGRGAEGKFYGFQALFKDD